MTSDYGDNSIKTLSGIQHYRFRASMYGFQVNNINGPLLAIKEIVDNSADEAQDPSKVYPIDITFFVSKDKSTYQCLVQDRGRGIPVGKLLDCLATANTSGKYEGNAYDNSTGTNGCGSKVVAALSKNFVAFTKRMDGFGYLRIEKGEVKDHWTTRRVIDKDASTVGTTVIFQPDEEMMLCTNEMFQKNVPNDDRKGFDICLERMEYYTVFRNNIRLTVRVVNGMLPAADFKRDHIDLWKYLTNLENFKYTIVYQAMEGSSPRQYVINKFHLKDILWELGQMAKVKQQEDDPMSYSIDIFIDEKSRSGNGGYIGAINGTPIVHPESSHIVVLQDVLKDQLLENIDDADAQAFFEAKYRIPFSGYVFAGWQGAEFIGQDKTRFENRRFSDCYRNSLRKAFRKITEARGEAVWDNLWELIKENFELEYAKFSKRSLGIGKSSKGLTYELLRSGSYAACKSGDNQVTELFITEGDSAAGRVKTVRDPNTQALLKLSGKPINAIRVNDRSKLDKNAIYKDLTNILNVWPAIKDPEEFRRNIRFNKILIMTDADADGYHIVALLIGIFYKINPLILSLGYVQVTMPPLYALKYKNTTAYIRDEAALRDVKVLWYKTLFDIDISVDFGKTAVNLNHSREFHETVLNDGTKVHRLNKKKDQFRDLCMAVDWVGQIVTHEADLLNIDAGLLEQLLHCANALDELHVDIPTIKKTLVGIDDVIWDKANNVLILVDIQGIETPVPLTKLKQVLLGTILPEYKRFHWDKFSLYITTKYTDLFCGTPCTFMMLYQVFKDLDDLCEVTRFKGLGEMSEQAIDATCVSKNSRCFLPITSIGDVDAIYKMLDVDTEARKKLVKGGYLEEA